MQPFKMYHYSDTKIASKADIDYSKCENGFWATDISPDLLEKYQDEIGAGGCRYAYQLFINSDAHCVDLMKNQREAKAEIEEDGGKYGASMYDTGEIEYTDFVFFNSDAIISMILLEA